MAERNEDGMTVVADNVIGHGSSGDHSHRLVGEGVAVLAPKDNPEARVVKVPAGAEVVCEKHDTIAIPPGEYEIGVVREQDHFAEEARNVYD